jgi:hypothetical protein
LHIITRYKPFGGIFVDEKECILNIFKFGIFAEEIDKLNQFFRVLQIHFGSGSAMIFPHPFPDPALSFGSTPLFHGPVTLFSDLKYQFISWQKCPHFPFFN